MNTRVRFSRNLISLVVASAGLSLATAQAQATEENGVNLSDMVVSASGFEQKLVEAPASISVISQQELRSRPYMTLLDIVRELEGVDVGETRDKTGQGSVSIRGMGGDYTLLLIDGRRQNNHGDIYPNNFGGNQFNYVPPLDAIERVEVIRGPASTLYGADAIGGVINIITKKMTDDWSGSATISRTFQEVDQYGDDTTADFTVSGPLIDNTLAMEVRGSLYQRDASEPEYDSVTNPAGQQQTRELGFGSGGKTVDSNNHSVGAGLNWQIDQRQLVTLDVDFWKQQYDNDPLADGSFPLGTVDSIDTLWNARGPRVGYAKDQQFTRQQIAIAHEGEWTFGNSWVSLQQITSANEGRTLPLSVAERQEFKTIFDGTGAYAGMSEQQRREIAAQKFLPRPDRVMESRQYTLDGKLEIPVDDFYGRHNVIVGGQLIQGELEDSVFGMEDGNVGELSDFTMFSLFAEDNWNLIEDVTLTAGLRYDDHDQFGSNISPRLYAVYLLDDNWTVKGGVATGYKTPKTTDLYHGVTGFGGQGTRPFAGNPDLEPEKSVNSELAVYWQSLNGDHDFNITLFKNDFKDKIISGDDVPSCEATGGAKPCVNLGGYEDLGAGLFFQKVNIDEAEIQGVELAGKTTLGYGLALKGNYTYTDSEQKSGTQKGYPLNGTAKNMANATLDWQANDAVSLYLTMEHRSDRFRGFGRSGLNEGKNGAKYFQDYQVFHLGMNYVLSETLSFSGRINNLLDRDFTSYEVEFEDDGNGGYDLIAYDDYNNKDKRRNLWLSMNVKF